MAELTPVTKKFVLHWGEMGTRWGINRTVAQIHALLYLSERPLTAEEITETLGVARSNVSNSLKELQNWGIVRVSHVMGDRRDHFESLTDVWEMFQIVLDERKRREIDPTLLLLDDCLNEAKASRRSEAHAVQRIEAMKEFFETTSRWYADLRKLPTGAVVKFVKMGGRLRKLLGVA